MNKLKSLEIIKAKSRISSIDVFRGLAIIPVVIYHFNGFLPFGYLGVDLFFVISGLLVGGILIRKFQRNEKVNFWHFILQRGFKIWPSYYWFLIFGSLLAYVFYSVDRPDYLIKGGSDALRYIFFYQNYTGAPYHWPFDHIWSLCIEEHFYILFPLMIMFIMFFFGNKSKVLLVFVCGLILAGIIFKFISFYFTNSKDTYAGTHARLDALGWGVLLGILITYHEAYFKKIKNLPILFILGVILFTINILLFIFWGNTNFEKMVFHSVTPICFFLMLLGVYFIDFSKWLHLRFIAYYSYNWYLWHPMFVFICVKYFGINWLSLMIYMIVSFLTAMVFTILVEEKFLNMRERVIGSLFKRRNQLT